MSTIAAKSNQGSFSGSNNAQAIISSDKAFSQEDRQRRQAAVRRYNRRIASVNLYLSKAVQL